MSKRFFLIGMPKSGTTSLHAALSKHPDTGGCKLKEPHYYAHDYLADSETVADEFRSRTREEYEALFYDCDQGKMGCDASTHYFASEHAADGIANDYPDAKIVVVLREPASFLHSFHQQLLRNSHGMGESETNLMKALDLEGKRLRGKRLPPRCEVPLMTAYSRHLRYVENLTRYQNRFREEQVKVLLFDDLCTAPEEILKQVCDFVGLDSHSVDSLPRENFNRRIRSRTLLNLVNSVAVGQGAWRPMKSIAKSVLPSGLRQRCHTRVLTTVCHAPPVSLDPVARAEIRREYHSEVLALDRHMPELRVLEKWGYEAAPNKRRPDLAAAN